MPRKPVSKKPRSRKPRVKSGSLPDVGGALQVAGAPSPASPAGAPPGSGLFPIVGVGASAGGFEAFSEMLRELPANPGMAIVFVQHLDPKHVSVLAQLLARESQMPVVEATSGMRVERDHVYVIPRNTSISVVNGVLELGPREVVGGQFTSIDIFFRSLADDQGSRGIGVLLSGNAPDGTLGLKAIKAEGGITFAQDPHTAKFDSMPRTAIAAGWVDVVRSPTEIVRELLRLGDHPYIAAEPEEAKEPPADGADAVNRILGVLRGGTGVDFSQYKASTVRRRIMRRMVLRRIDSLENYLTLVRSEPAEVQALYEDILINVTEFFRDSEAFAALIKNIFPRLINQRRQSPEIRVWVPGCSTGEEAYSIAIAMLEALGDQANEANLQVFASDISESALEKGRAGVYPMSIAQNVSADRLRRFFVKSDSGYQINKRVRELCIFARHNLAKDPPFSRIDFVSCRNVLIYLGPGLQDRIIPMFHYALKPNGYLLLGSSETVGHHSELFQLFDKKHKIYQRKPAPGRLALDFPVEQVLAERAEARRKPEPVSEYDLQREADRLVLARYAPPGVLVDEDLNILQFRGQTSAFLAPAAGVASLNLLRMLKEGLTVEVRTAIASARKQNAPVRRERVHFAANGSKLVNIEVIPLRRSSAGARKLLVLFELVPEEAPPKQGRRRAGEDKRLIEENEQLRHELAASKEYLQAIIEDQEAAQEELRSATEEIQSSNEELQSTNEELETAKEELQSTNEELNTVNEELQNRNMQLAQVGNDLLNLLANVNMPILILGNDLRIRRFTPVAEKTLNLIPSDVGRPIRDINLRISVPHLEKELTEVVENLTPKVVEVADPDGRAYSLRIRPYRTEDNKIDGVVMVFIDVDPVMRVAESAAIATLPAEISSANARALLLMAQEEERRRLSHELHDEMNQRLALLEFNIESIQMRKDPDEALRHLEDLRKNVAALSEDVRRIAYQLHPTVIDLLGLVPALQGYCDEFSSRERIQVRFTHHGIPGELPPPVALTAYRVVQESLRNAAKHSGAKQASVALAFERGQLELIVRDSGCGFYPETVVGAGLGMVGMRERVHLAGGTIEWRSKPGEGTQVTVKVPLGEEPAGTSEDLR
ncbi:MAG: PAS domain-containing protein [Bryobacteraceae bacterium]|nr:PAS domain-containing protein [Bryobacteraceae bacterium]